MSGVTAATIIAASSAAIGAGSLAYSVVQGQDASSQQAAALKKQNTAQQTAEGQALSTQRQAAVAQGEANQKTPDISSILARAAQGGKGLGSTLLTGSGGLDTSGLNLGKTTLLGS